MGRDSASVPSYLGHGTFGKGLVFLAVSSLHFLVVLLFGRGTFSFATQVVPSYYSKGIHHVITTHLEATALKPTNSFPKWIIKEITCGISAGKLGIGKGEFGT